MSDATKALELLEGVKSDFDVLKSSIDDLKSDKLSATEAVDMKATIGNIEVKMNERDQEIEKLTKAIDQAKAKNEFLSSVDSDVQKQKECLEFIKSIRACADQNNSMNGFSTSDFKSVKELKNYNSGDDAAAGATIVPFLDSRIDKLIREFSDVRTLATTATISGDKWEQLKLNQTNGAQWAKNMADFTTQTKNDTLSKLSIMVEDLYGIAIFQDNLINDAAFDIVGEILTSLAEDFAIREADSFWTGNGVGEMSGILNAPVVGAGKGGFDEIERITTVGSTAVVLEDIFDLIGALKAPYQNGAQFKANRLGITQLRKLKDSYGQFLWQPSNIVGVPATLAGYPISQAQELAADITAANAEGVVFGNYGAGYRIIDRMGMDILRDNLTTWPEVSYKAKKRVGGGIQKGEALKILKTQA